MFSLGEAHRCCSIEKHAGTRGFAAQNRSHNMHMERNLATSLASRAIVFGIVIVLLYYISPDSGVSALRKMNAALNNARSWQVHTVVNEPTKNIESTVEVYCPSRLHSVRKSVVTDGGTPIENADERIWIEGANYTRKGLHWTLTHEDRMQTASCALGARAYDSLLQSMDLILINGKVRKGSKRLVAGERCRDWILSVPAPAGWRDEYGVCLGDQDLPLEIFTPDRRMVETYSDWNLPIKIEAPAAEDIVLR